MWPAEGIMQSMRPAMLCRFPTLALDVCNTNSLLILVIPDKSVGWCSGTDIAINTRGQGFDIRASQIGRSIAQR